MGSEPPADETLMQHVQKGNWRSYYQIETKNLKTGRVLTNRHATHDNLEFVNVDQRKMQYLYSDPDGYHFMDTESYEQIQLDEGQIGDAKNFILPDSVVSVELFEDRPLGVDKSRFEIAHPVVEGRAVQQELDTIRLGGEHVLVAGEGLERPGPDVGVGVVARQHEQPLQVRRVAGAVGFNVRTGDYHVFKSKAVIVGAGGASSLARSDGRFRPLSKMLVLTKPGHNTEQPICVPSVCKST